MVRVDNDMIEVVARATAYAIKKFNLMNQKLAIENENSPNYKTSYINGLDGSAKQDGAAGIKMLRWLITTNLGLPVPLAYTDTEVDTIDDRIRTHEST